MLGEHLDPHEWELFANQPSGDSDESTPFRTPNRQGGRISISAKMTIQPANASERNQWTTTGTCRDLSEKGIGTLLKSPPIVGDFYWVEIDAPELKYQTGICRCIRCQFLREDAFEAGFEFLTGTAPQIVQSATASDELL
jgi:hypothetical protein